MMHFNGSYTMSFNRRHVRSGHVYQGRYHAVVVEQDAYLLEASRYLHLNPVRVRSGKEMSTGAKHAELLKNQWCSYAGHVSVRGRDPFVEYSEILDYFGGDNARGRRGYVDFVLEGIEEGCPNPFAKAVGRIMLGSEDFVERIKARFLANGEDIRELPSLRVMTENVEPERVLGVISEALGAAAERLTARGKCTVERGLAMEAVYRYCGLTQPRIGELFGGVDYSTVSVTRKRFLQRMKQDPHVHRTFTRITREIGKIQE
jgi:hypothetical protein